MLCIIKLHKRLEFWNLECEYTISCHVIFMLKPYEHFSNSNKRSHQIQIDNASLELRVGGNGFCNHIHFYSVFFK